jgi:gliding motility-associated-like protein
VSGLTIAPAANFNGTLSVPVTVNDGVVNSAPFNLQIQVLAENDAPVITGQSTSITINEDEPITLQLTDLLVTDFDNSFPTGFLLNVSNGTNYSVSGTTVTPVANFNGTLTIPVTVSDGFLLSAGFNVSIVVSPVNDPPVITGQTALTTSEETPLTIELSHLTVTDVDNTYPEGFSLIVASGTNYTVSGTTITPALDFGGTLTVSVQVNDGATSSLPFNLLIQVGGSNDSPVITAQTEITTNEDEPFTILFTHLTVTDIDNTYPQGFSLIVSAGDNYTVTDATIQPTGNFNGILTIPVMVNDGGTNSNSFSLQLTVLPVNDAPVITAQTPLTVFKNKDVTLSLSHLTVSDPDNLYPDNFTLNVEAGDHYQVFGQTIIPDTEYTGLLSIPVSVSDGTLSSPTFSLAIDVIPPPNVTPVITSQIKLTTFENESIELQLSHLVVTDPDNRFPDDFTMEIFEGDNYSVSGNLIIPAEDFAGTLQVTVTVSDRQSTSEPFDVVIDVIPVTDVPLITSQAFLRMNEDDSLTLTFGDLIVLDPDNSYPSGFKLIAGSGDNYTINGLMIKPKLDFNGYLSVPVTVNDGVNTSSIYQLLILIDPVNDPPVISESASGNLFFTMGNGSMPVFENITITDVDDDTLSLAEVAISAADFESGKDSLIFESTQHIRAVFDQSIGLLVMFGKASVADYQAFIKTIHYDYNGIGEPLHKLKTLRVTVNDGKATSNEFEKVIAFDDQQAVLDIPTGFTPNGDGANDTWSIQSMQGNDSFSNATIRVYNRKGTIVFEAEGLNKEWDGRMNGSLLPADSYFYVIDLNSSTTSDRYKGVITILR